jgi:hypothetical protein
MGGGGAGEEKGREVTDRLLPKLPNPLRCGAFSLLVIPENCSKDTKDFINEVGFDIVKG